MMSQPINLNRAEVQTLAQLPGIGEQLAQRIVAFRDEVHPFEEIVELAAVPGISERMVRELAPDITVGTVLKTETPDAALVAVRKGDGSVVPEAATAHIIVRAEDIAGERTAAARPAPTARSTSRGSPWGYLFSSLAGALLALLILVLLNGDLHYGSDANADRLQGELQRQRDDQSALRQQLEQTLMEQAAAASQQATTSVQLGALQESATAEIATVAAAGNHCS